MCQNVHTVVACKTCDTRTWWIINLFSSLILFQNTFQPRIGFMIKKPTLESIETKNKKPINSLQMILLCYFEYRGKFSTPSNGTQCSRNVLISRKFIFNMWRVNFARIWFRHLHDMANNLNIGAQQPKWTDSSISF